MKPNNVSPFIDIKDLNFYPTFLLKLLFMSYVILQGYFLLWEFSNKIVGSSLKIVTNQSKKKILNEGAKII